MSKYEVGIEQTGFTLFTKAKEVDDAIKNAKSIFPRVYETEEQAEIAYNSLIMDIVKEVLKTKLKLIRIGIAFKTGYTDIDFYAIRGSTYFATVTIYKKEISTEAIVLTKSIFGSNNEYLFSETIGKTDSQKQAENLRDIDKQKFSESYKQNGWNVYYFFNKVEV